MSEEESEGSPVVEALLVAGVKGSIAGLLFAGVLVGLGYSFNAKFRLPVEVILLTLGSFMLGGAMLCAFDAAAARIRGGAASAAVRALGGLLAPIAMTAPFYGIRTGALVNKLDSAQLEVLSSIGASFALALVFAGRAADSPHERQGCWRVLRIAFFATGALAFLKPPPAEIGYVSFFISGGVIAGLFWLGQALAAPFARRLALRFDPRLANAHLSESWRLTLELEAAERALAKAANDEYPGARPLRLEAFEALERAEALCRENEVERRRIALGRIEVLFEDGNLLAAERAAAAAGTDAVLRAEAARRKGDLAGAEQLAQSALEERPADESYRARSSRANALVVLALVRCAQGRGDEARRLLDDARRMAEHPEVFLHRLTFERARASIERSERA